jgi:FkbM family methyltransferase
MYNACGQNSLSENQKSQPKCTTQSYSPQCDTPMSYFQKIKFFTTSSIQAWLRRRGREVVRWPGIEHLARHNISLVFDVGASDGAYALQLREYGYKGRIVSFEPRAEAYQLLQQRASTDPLWNVENVAIGEKPGTLHINVASSGDSSSFLPMLERHVQAAPGIVETGVEAVAVLTFDQVFARYIDNDVRVALKVDTQGYEMSVLRSARDSLARISLIQLELSLVRLYEGAPLIEEVITFLRSSGFSPIWLLHGFADPRERELLQMDGIFKNQQLR